MKFNPINLMFIGFLNYDIIILLESGKRKNMKNKKALASMVIGIITTILILMAPTNNTYIIIVGIMGIIPIVLSIIAKKEMNLKKIKGEAKAGFILGIVTLSFAIIYILAMKMISDVEIASMAYCPNKNQVSSCKYNDDGETSTCLFMDQLVLKCKNDVLTEEQYEYYISTQSDDALATKNE
jgi:hypothetical protein